MLLLATFSGVSMVSRRELSAASQASSKEKQHYNPQDEESRIWRGMSLCWVAVGILGLILFLTRDLWFKPVWL